jgi:hypothetical protein
MWVSAVRQPAAEAACARQADGRAAGLRGAHALAVKAGQAPAFEVTRDSISTGLPSRSGHAADCGVATEGNIEKRAA